MRTLPFFLLCSLLACREPRLPPAAPLPDSIPPPPGTTALDPDGIDKVYMGRQIARVMGHEGADWLERAGRDREEATDVLLRELRVRD
ncbi:MAG: hypothetical protein H7330_02840, partial [Hymenobacteraceae bacterium]|nr:hypothetical protein [Hymenobacteraceae bacterium]